MSDVREPLQNPQQNLYAAIDLKSFYASVECVERGLDALTTHLVVADLSLAGFEALWHSREGAAF